MNLSRLFLLPILATGLFCPLFCMAFTDAYKEELDLDFFHSKHPNLFTAVEKAVYEAKAYPSAPNVINFSETAYKAAKSENDSFLIRLDGVEGVTIDGHNAVLTIDAFNSFLSITNSKNVSVQNFTVIFDRPPFTKGLITSPDAGALSFVFNSLDGYPALPSDIWAKKTYGENAWGIGTAINGPVSVNAPVSLSVKKVEELGPRKYRVFVDESSRDALAGLKDGAAFAMPVPVEPNDRLFGETKPVLNFLNFGLNGGALTPRNAVPSVYVAKSSNVRLENITIVRPPAVGIAIFQNEGPVAINSCEIRTDSNIGTLSPALRAVLIADNRRGPSVSGCSFAGYFKYCVEIASTPAFICEKTDELNYRISGAKLGTDAPLGAYYPETEAWFDTVNVRSSNGDEAGLDKPIAGIVLKGEGPNPDATQIFNLNYVNDGFRIAGCRFAVKGICDILARGTNGDISANRFAIGGTGGICIGNISGSPKMGPHSKNIRAIGNEFSEAE